MKSTILSLTAFACLSLSLLSCKKEPTLKDQLVGNWVSIEVLSGSNDISGSSTFELNLESSNEFALDISSIVPITGKVTQSFNGDWEIDDLKQDIKLTYNDTGNVETWEVVSISNTNLKTIFYDNNTKYQINFKRQ